MNATNDQKGITKKKTKKAQPEIDLHIAPQNGKVSREIVAKWGEKEFTDVINPFKATARENFAQRVAKTFGIENHQAQTDLCDLIVKRAKEADAVADQLAREAAEAAPGGVRDLTALALANTPDEVKAAAEAFLENPELMSEVESDFKQLGIAGETHLAKSLYMIGTSRLLNDPLGGTVKASSSSGKSFVSEKVTDLMPEEDVIQATNITPNALYYMPEGSLKNKLVVVGERAHANTGDQADAANATLALREMMSRGRLDKFVPVKGAEGGIQTQHITQEGPIAYIDTTTQQEIFEEDATRMLSLTTDESREQTQAIMLIQARQAAWAATSDSKQDAIRQKHRTAQRLLKPWRVRIPFAEHLVLPATKLVSRRAFPQLLGFIEVVALLRQRQKTIHDDGHIDATVRDYEIAYDLMVPILQRTFASLNDRAKNLLAAILEHALMSESFTRNDCVKWAGVGLTEVRNRLNVLVEAGLVEQVTGGKGVSYKYRVTSTKTDRPELKGLVKPVELRKLVKNAKKSKK